MDPLAGRPDGTHLARSAHIRSTLGSGSNAVVLCAVFPDSAHHDENHTLSDHESHTLSAHDESNTLRESMTVPRGRKVAIKVMSHFWDIHAKRLLDCERATLRALPPHPCIIRVHAEFASSVPDNFIPFISGDMATAASDTAAGYTTQMFVMEFQPLTLDAYRYVLPTPLPWHVMWGVASDLISAVEHMERHRAMHLDLKLDNVMVSYDARCVLTDFGISRVFAHPDLTLTYTEPFDLLMNRLVLAPEVLRSHDDAKAAWKEWRRSREIASPRPIAFASVPGAGAIAEEPPASQPTPSSLSRRGSAWAAHAGSAVRGEDLPRSRTSRSGASTPRHSPAVPPQYSISFGCQGVWSVGVILYELACGFGHDPAYPHTHAHAASHGPTYDMCDIPPPPVVWDARTRGAFEAANDTTATNGAAASAATSSSGASRLRRHSNDEVWSSRDEDAEGALSPPVADAYHTRRDGVHIYGVRGAHGRGYPLELVACIMSMLHPSPANRLSTAACAALLRALQPRYIPTRIPDARAMQHLRDAAAACRSPAAAGSMRVRLPDDGLVDVPLDAVRVWDAATSSSRAQPVSHTDVQHVLPVVLRHVCGAARLLLVHDDVPLQALVAAWGDGAEYRIVTCVPQHDVEALLGESATPTAAATPALPRGLDSAGSQGTTETASSRTTMASTLTAMLGSVRTSPPSAAGVHVVRVGDEGCKHESLDACRFMLGGCELTHTATVGSLMRYWAHTHAYACDWTHAPTHTCDATHVHTPAQLRMDAHAHMCMRTSVCAMVLDLIPTHATTLTRSADALVQMVSHAQHATADAPVPPPDLFRPLPPTLSQPGAHGGADRKRTTSETAIKHNRDVCADTCAYMMDYVRPHVPGRTLSDTLARLQAGSSSVLPMKKTASDLATQSRMTMCEGVTWRCMLALTCVANAALKGDASGSSGFPFHACADLAIASGLKYTSTHETIGACLGLLRNLTCTDALSVASHMCVRALDVCIKAYVHVWLNAAAVAVNRSASENPSHTCAHVHHDTPACSVCATSAATVCVCASVHGGDARLCEDALLAISNLLRFDELQTAAVPFAALSRVCVDALRRHANSQSIVDACVRVYRYILCIDSPEVPAALVESGALHVLVHALHIHSSDRAMCEGILHVVCSLLTHECARQNSVCPYKVCTSAVVHVMTTHGEDAHLLALSCTVIRNLACVDARSPHASNTASPAVVIADMGAPAALEAAMERHPNNTSIQDNGRCALYNLVLLAAGDVRALSEALSATAGETAALKERVRSLSHPTGLAHSRLPVDVFPVSRRTPRSGEVMSSAVLPGTVLAADAVHIPIITEASSSQELLPPTGRSRSHASRAAATPGATRDPSLSAGSHASARRVQSAPVTPTLAVHASVRMDDVHVGVGVDLTAAPRTAPRLSPAAAIMVPSVTVATAATPAPSSQQIRKLHVALMAMALVILALVVIAAVAFATRS